MFILIKLLLIAVFAGAGAYLGNKIVVEKLKLFTRDQAVPCIGLGCAALGFLLAFGGGTLILFALAAIGVALAVKLQKPDSKTDELSSGKQD